MFVSTAPKKRSKATKKTGRRVVEQEVGEIAIYMHEFSRKVINSPMFVRMDQLE